MKKTPPFILLITIALSFVSCLSTGKKGEDAIDSEDFTRQQALGLYEIMVPNDMKKTNTLNADASLQYQNIFKETYLAVIEEPKDDFVDIFTEIEQYDTSKSVVGNYQKFQMDYFTEGMQIDNLSAPKAMTINGLNAEQVALNGRVPGIDYDIYYVMTFVEGADNLYMIMSWTLGDKEDTHKKTFEYMANSFREL